MAPTYPAPPPARAHLGDRSLFPQLAARAYLAHAAFSPISVPVQAAVQQFLSDFSREGVGAFGRWQTDRETLRAKLATFVGAAADDIAFLPNTTSGVIAVAQCLPWRTGDRILVFDGEFPANVTPWQRAAAQYDLEVVMLPVADLAGDTGPDWQPIDEALRRGIRLVAVSAVQFQTGLRVPLAELAARCRARGAQIFVDGIQACGALPLDVGTWGIDYLACGGHKWMMGLEGAGFLYVAPERARALRPHLAGWLSHEHAVDFLLEGPGHLRYDRPIRKHANFLEGGTGNSANLAGLHAAVDLLAQLGTEAVYAHVTAYLDRLEPALVERGFISLREADEARRSTILSVAPPDGLSAVDLAGALLAQGVVCSAPDGFLRFAPHWPNAIEEIAHIISAIDSACVRLRS